MIVESKPVVLFDGVCNLCNRSVQFVIRHDPHAKIRFTSIQSESGARILNQFKYNGDMASFIYIEKGKLYTRSTAALSVCRHLSGVWKLAVVLLVVPRPIRDWIYNRIAKNRYKWFGKRDSCMLPTAANRGRFLE